MVDMLTGMEIKIGLWCRSLLYIATFSFGSLCFKQNSTVPLHWTCNLQDSTHHTASSNRVHGCSLPMNQKSDSCSLMLGICSMSSKKLRM